MFPSNLLMTEDIPGMTVQGHIKIINPTPTHPPPNETIPWEMCEV